MNLPIVGITLAILFTIAPLANSASTSSQTIVGNGNVQTNPIPQQLAVVSHRHFIENGVFSAEQEASACDIWTGHRDALHRATELHALNSEIICLLYRNIRTVWGPNHSIEYDLAQLQLFINNGWILKGEDGDFVVVEDGMGYLVDVGNSDYQSWVAQWLKTHVLEYGANGAYLDNCLASSEITWNASKTPINPRTGAPWTSQEWNNAVISIVNKVKTVLGDAMYIVGNGIWSGASWNNRLQYYKSLLLNSSIDGIVSEGWISDYSKSSWYDEATWKSSVDMAVWINNNFLSKGDKFFIALAYNAAEGTVPTGSNPEQYALFNYASLLLAASHRGNSISYGSYLMNDYTQSLFKTNVGTPTNNYALIPNTHVYTRDFTNVKVLVNPTNTAYNVNLPQEYILQGVLVSALMVQPHTGIILTRR